MKRLGSIFLLWSLILVNSGCGLIATFPRGRVTAVPLSPWNQNEPEGIPYYLPKPLLVISKNVRHVEESQIGLTNPAPIPNTFDNQASYADVKANVTVPDKGIAAADDENPALLKGEAYQAGLNIGASIVDNTELDDGLQPEVYYTYQIIFVPDLTQKYGLRIKGGPGEIRAAMNFVNGWMYTGMGPYYLKDSSTAQNLISCGVGAMYAGRGVADVVGQAANLAEKLRAENAPMGGVESDKAVEMMRTYMAFMDKQRDEEVVREIPDYAEITIYEPMLTDCGETQWRMVAHQTFDREYFPRGASGVEANRMLIQGLLNCGAFAPTASNQEPETPESAAMAPQSSQGAQDFELNELGQQFAAEALGFGMERERAESAELEVDAPPPPPVSANPFSRRHAACSGPLGTCCWRPPAQRPQYRTTASVVSSDWITQPARTSIHSTGQRNGAAPTGENQNPQLLPANGANTTGGSPPGDN